MSIYHAATWNTELDISRIARPDSLLAFHFEPLLVLLLPVYAIGGISALLVLQALALASGALPLYRVARHATGQPWAAAIVGVAYLLSPLGQWVALSDFHTSALAVPLLLLAAERLVVAHHTGHALLAAALAAGAREDVGLAVAALGVLELARSGASATRSARAAALGRLELGRSGASATRSARAAALGGACSSGVREMRAGLSLLVLGASASALGFLVIRAYSGGAVSPFDVRYAQALSPGGMLEQLSRAAVRDYAITLAASGGWLALLSPLTLLPALPSLVLNVLSSSSWMASGKAHYSAVVLPFVALGAAAGLGRLARARPSLMRPAGVVLLVTSSLGYVVAGAGPLGANYAPAAVTDHAREAAALAASLPPSATVSASTALVPHLSQRSHVYVFPAVLDADYVLLDLRSTTAPTSAGDVYLRTQALLADGWSLAVESDGLLLLEHVTSGSPEAPGPFQPQAQSGTAEPRLLHAELVPSPDGAIGVDGPHWILRTTWRADAPVAVDTRIGFVVHLRDGSTRSLSDVADLWWNPPERWPPNGPVTIDVPDIPGHAFVSFEPIVRTAAR